MAELIQKAIGEPTHEASSSANTGIDSRDPKATMRKAAADDYLASISNGTASTQIGKTKSIPGDPDYYLQAEWHPDHDGEGGRHVGIGVKPTNKTT